jgi:multidrug efflux pump subunit AcrA (membrane-fusion protein)
MIALACAGLLGAGICVFADELATQPTAEPEVSGLHSRVVAPFNLLSDLSDDQKAQMRAIHAETLAEEKALRDKEHDEIFAILSDNQKKELQDVETRTEAQKKADSAQRRADAEEREAQALKQQAQSMVGSTTQPSGASN